jgi:hypothetical protein
MKKLSDDYEPKQEKEQHQDDNVQPPVNRLKDLIESSKMKTSPWDSAADYGNIDSTSQHLNKYNQPYKNGKISVEPHRDAIREDTFAVDFSIKSRGGYHPVAFATPHTVPQSLYENGRGISEF